MASSHNEMKDSESSTTEILRIVIADKELYSAALGRNQTIVEYYKNETKKAYAILSKSNSLENQSIYHMLNAKWNFCFLEETINNSLRKGFSLDLLRFYLFSVVTHTPLRKAFANVLPDHELLTDIKIRFNRFTNLCKTYVSNRVDADTQSLCKEIDGLLSTLPHPWVNGAQKEIETLRASVKKIQDTFTKQPTEQDKKPQYLAAPTTNEGLHQAARLTRT